MYSATNVGTVHKDLTEITKIINERQSASLEEKIRLSQLRIKEWYDGWDGLVYVAYSGGKDSTVLLHMVRELYPDVPAVYNRGGVEYPEVDHFVIRHTDNLEILRPKMNFKQVCDRWGYPIVSKDIATKIYEVHNSCESRRNLRLYGRPNDKFSMLPKKWRFLLKADFKIHSKCCAVIKKRPAISYETKTNRKPFIGFLVDEGPSRRGTYVKNGGCNGFDASRPTSNPLSMWNDDNIWEYIKGNNVPYCSIYDVEGFERTGCFPCMFGIFKEKGENRFQRMRKTHPKLWKYCMDYLDIRKVMNFLSLPTGDEEAGISQP